MTHPESHDPLQVARALSYLSDVLHERGDDIGKVRVESNQAWLIVDLWFKGDPKLPITMTKPHKFGIWLYTGVPYACDEFGAAEEDPCDLRTWMPAEAGKRV